jgi:phosphoribosylformylglycinamidine synthase
MRLENRGNCRFTHNFEHGRILHVPVAHAEGRFLFPKGDEEKLFRKLQENDQLVFRYCYESGELAANHFPTNPNGSFQDIAGICNPEGNILGLMPHPERAFYSWQQPDWTRREKSAISTDGSLFFESIVSYLEKRILS